MDLTIDNELRDLIHPLEAEEFTALEASILAEGVRDPLVVWGGVLVDGHHRYQVCQKHNLDFPTIYREFDDKRAVRIWMLENQIGKRNVSKMAKVEYALQIADELAAQAKERQRAALIEGNKTRHEEPPIVHNCSQSADKKPAPKTRDLVAEKAGVSHRIVTQATVIHKAGTDELKEAARDGKVSFNSGAEIAKLPEEEQLEILKEVDNGVKASKALQNAKAKKKQEKRKAAIAEIEERTAAITGPTGVFDVIVIDPPWPYADKKPEEAYNPDGRRAANPYPEMSLEEIAAIELPAADDCVLWLWTTHKFMRDSFSLLDTWGFRDKAILTWRKDRMGLGSWLRSQSEFCIMAVKGKPIIQLTNQTTVIDGPLREHSRKPDEFYAMVDSLCVGRKIDWFSRETRQGWVQYGNDEEKFSAEV